MLSALCAAAMLATALPAASAVENTEPLYEYAGETIAVQVMERVDGVPTSRIVEVSIPENATESQARTMINAAAFGLDTATPYQSNIDVGHFLGNGKRNITLTRAEKEIMKFTLDVFLTEIYVVFHISDMAPNTEIEVQLRNKSDDSISAWEIARDVSYDNQVVIHEVLIRDDRVRMYEGDKIEVYGRTNNGSMVISSCSATGYNR